MFVAYPVSNITEQIVPGQSCEVQEVSTRGAVGGSFTLTFGGEETAEIPWNATADNVRAALEVGQRDADADPDGGGMHPTFACPRL